MSRKDQAAELLLDGLDVPMVAAATGLQPSTVRNIRRRLDQPVIGDGSYKGAGLLRCRGCGIPYTEHTLLRRCPALAD